MFKNVFIREDEPPKPAPKPRKSTAPGVEVVDDEEDYDPFEHRHITSPTSDFGAMAHMLKTSLGSGILAMPLAFKHAGLVLGTFGTLLIGAICAHCVQMLVWNAQFLCKKYRVPTMTYAETAEAAFKIGPTRCRKCSKAMGILITVVLIGSFILGNSVYAVFIAHTIEQIVEFYFRPEIDIRIYTVLIWLPLTIMCMVPNLKGLVPFSTLANLFILACFLITLYYIFRELNSTADTVMFAPFTAWPLFLCTVIFAVEGIGTVLCIENEMKNPGRFISGKCPILHVSMVIVVVLYAFVGFFGYLEYGDLTKGSITLNLPVQEPMAQTVKALIGIAIFFTYALQFYVPIILISDMINKRIPSKYHRAVKISVRVGLVASTIIISIVIPHLEPFISLVGAICFSTLGLLFPSLIDQMSRYPEYGAYNWRLWKNLFIQVVSFMALFSGAYMSCVHIIGTYSSGEGEEV